MKTYFAGIDPGLTGAVALLDATGRLLTVHDAPTLVVKTGKMNRTLFVESQMITILESMMAVGTIAGLGIENVHAMPKQGVTSMFNMGMGFGLWLGIIATLRLPYTRIEPLRWKKSMGIAGGADKNASIVRALQLFPRADLARKKDHGRADAILIAEYTRRVTLANS